MTLVEYLVEDLDDVTLIDEHTKSILTVNKEIPSNMTMWRHLVAKFFKNASGATCWPTFQVMQVAPLGG